MKEVLLDNAKEVADKIIKAENQAIEKWLRKCLDMAPVKHETHRESDLKIVHKVTLNGEQIGPSLIITRGVVGNKFRTSWKEEATR